METHFMTDDGNTNDTIPTLVDSIQGDCGGKGIEETQQGDNYDFLDEYEGIEETQLDNYDYIDGFCMTNANLPL